MLLDRLERRLELLAGGARDLPERQQTIRATIDWSYDLLSADEQALFADLGVFAGGASLELVEQVCEGQAVLPLLSSLLDKSLLRAIGDEPRFAMLETVREYALERLAGTSVAEQVQRRHAECFCLLAERAEPELVGPEQATWLPRLELEHDNFRAALAWAVANGDGELAARLANGLGRFWNIHGYLGEGRRWFERALEAGEGPPPALRAKLLNRIAGHALRQGQGLESEPYAGASLELCRELGDLAGMGMAMNHLAHAALKLGEYDLADERHRAALEYYTEAGDMRGMAMVTGNRGCVAIQRGELELARELSTEALRAFRELGDVHNVANALHNAALVDVAGKQWREAEPVLHQSLAAAMEVGFKESIAFTLETLAVIHVAAGDPPGGTQLLGAASELETEMGMSLDDPEASMHDDAVDAARAALGAEFDELWIRGRGLGLERAVALAFEISLSNSSD